MPTYALGVYSSEGVDRRDKKIYRIVLSSYSSDDRGGLQEFWYDFERWNGEDY